MHFINFAMEHREIYPNIQKLCSRLTLFSQIRDFSMSKGAITTFSQGNNVLNNYSSSI